MDDEGGIEGEGGGGGGGGAEVKAETCHQHEGGNP